MVDVIIADTTLTLGETTNVSVVVKDPLGQPVTGELVTFFGSLGIIAPDSVVTNARGEASTTYRAVAKSGAAVIQALVDSANGSEEIQIVEKTEPRPTATPRVTPTPLPGATPTATPLPATFSASATRVAPGSHIVFTGSDLPKGEKFTVTVNDVTVGTVTSDAGGTVDFTITTDDTTEGTYTVALLEVRSASVAIVVDASAPLIKPEVQGTSFPLQTVPPLDSRIYLPLIGNATNSVE